ncbi:septum site-determining protein MinC [Cardiobacteriaceae bacterium TAE3-ERU3]|nr:septum site-determining protein MinC [Cardiobacteriaceae bacterium TAE3-ERU3]
MFKNRQAGITTITLDSDDQALMQAQLENAVGKAPQGFFTSMPFVADLNQAAIDSAERLIAIKKLFLEFGLTLIGISNHRCDASVLQAAGLADIQLAQTAEKRMPTASGREKANQPTPEYLPEQPAACNAKIIRQHVRSGQRVYAKGCDLIVIGTVGAGAEIIADGHISVYGSLRGRAFAGAKGDHDCIIFCSELAAELVSIAGCYQNMEQLEPYKGQKNCLITLDSDELMSVRSLMPK